MKIISYMIVGIMIAYFSLYLGENGLVLLGGAAFGLLLYIATTVSKKK
ncbi:hypothetical protein ACX93W_06130 [Paenibacillus sp. CAU 1782]